jgi:hypothetical protein
MVTQSFTFFFTPDVIRATDRSQDTLWAPSNSLSSTSSQGIPWVKPLR